MKNKALFVFVSVFLLCVAGCGGGDDKPIPVAKPAAIPPSGVLTNLVKNGGFEHGTPGSRVPSSYGYWSGDNTTVVGIHNRIAPHEGRQMIKFNFSGPDGPSAHTASELYQIVDVSAHLADIRAGGAIAYASAYVNRVHIDSKTDSHFKFGLYAYDGPPSSLFDKWVRNDFGVAHSLVGVISDADVETWERIDTILGLPVNTDYLVVYIGPMENIFNDASGTEFDGHYGDSVKLVISAKAKHAGTYTLTPEKH